MINVITIKNTKLLYEINNIKKKQQIYILFHVTFLNNYKQDANWCRRKCTHKCSTGCKKDPIHTEYATFLPARVDVSFAWYKNAS